MKTTTPFIVGCIVAGMLVIGALPVPYPYYGFLKLVIIAASITLSVCAVARDKPVLIVPFAIIALAFIAIKGLPKEAWAIIDIVCAIFFASIGSFLSKQEIVNQ
jgi:hypothetical protein